MLEQFKDDAKLPRESSRLGSGALDDPSAHGSDIELRIRFLQTIKRTCPEFFRSLARAAHAVDSDSALEEFQNKWDVHAGKESGYWIHFWLEALVAQRIKSPQRRWPDFGALRPGLLSRERRLEELQHRYEWRQRQRFLKYVNRRSAADRSKGAASSAFNLALRTPDVLRNLRRLSPAINRLLQLCDCL